MSDLSRAVAARPSQHRGRRGSGLPRRSLASSAFVAVLAVVTALLSFVATAPAQAAIGVSASRTVSGFPRWYEDLGGTRIEPCFENDPARCVLLADAGFDPAQPLVFPTNFPGEFFYSIVDSDVISTPGCQGTRPGKALVRLARGLLPRHLPLFVMFRDADVEALLDPRAAATADESDLYVSAAAAELTTFRDRVVRDLKKQGAMVLDVPTGELTPQLMNRYLEIKARHLL